MAFKNKTTLEKSWWYFISFLAIDLLSWLAFQNQLLGNIIFIILILTFLVLSYVSLPWAVLIFLIELILGSKGYLFFYSGNDLQISIRIGWFLVLMAVFVAKLFIPQTGLIWRQHLRHHKLFYAWLVACLAIVWAAMIGIGYNNFANWFLDLNAYFYLAVFLPLLVCWPEVWSKLKLVLIPAFSYLAFKTIVFFYLYSHFTTLDLDPLYHWFRNTGFGEISYFGGPFFRIFSQSQIFILLSALFSLLSVWFMVAKDNLSYVTFFRTKINWWLFAIFQLLALIISLSRSFWLGFIIAWLAALIYLLITKTNLLSLVRGLIISLSLIIIAVGLYFGVAQLPWPKPIALAGQNILMDRLTQGAGEAAGAARLQLLSPLWQRIEPRFLSGSGFGTTVTYLTTDPRIVSQAVGKQAWYTTYAFEWGYLDMWLKFGLVALMLYLYFFLSLITTTLGAFKKISFLSFIGLACLLSLAVTNITTPYLNHPLGIGAWLVIGLYLYHNKNNEQSI